MRRTTRSLMRRLGALALAVGLLPAASGGAACVAHWVGGDLHAQSAVSASSAQATHDDATDEHATHEHAMHAHMAPEHAAHAHGAHSEPSPDAPPVHDAEAPCTALAACGVLAAVESPTRPLPPAAPAVAVRSGQHLAPPGPAPAPDVPPPRR